MINFQISGIKRNEFNTLFKANRTELLRLGAVKMIVKKKPGYPCRISLVDAEPGEEVILFPFEHQPVQSPYRASGAIFIRKNAVEPKLGINEIPAMLEHRLLSLRGYDRKGMMVAVRTAEGEKLRSAIEDIFQKVAVDYIHVHNAGPGCYNCRIDRHQAA